MNGLEMKYFVLKPHGDDIYAAASRRAMLIYADTIEAVNAQFAIELREWALREGVDHRSKEFPIMLQKE
ncbi:MAG: hypothetical protein ABFD60_07955 [Bryobacteraceae bacterium]